MNKITETLRNLGIKLFVLATLKELQLTTLKVLLPFVCSSGFPYFLYFLLSELQIYTGSYRGYAFLTASRFLTQFPASQCCTLIQSFFKFLQFLLLSPFLSIHSHAFPTKQCSFHFVFCLRILFCLLHFSPWNEICLTHH